MVNFGVHHLPLPCGAADAPCEAGTRRPVPYCALLRRPHLAVGVSPWKRQLHPRAA